MGDFEKMSGALENADFETFIEKVKELPVYSVYESAVKKKAGRVDDTAKFL